MRVPYEGGHSILNMHHDLLFFQTLNFAVKNQECAGETLYSQVMKVPMPVSQSNSFKCVHRCVCQGLVGVCLGGR